MSDEATYMDRLVAAWARWAFTNYSGLEYQQTAIWAHHNPDQPKRGLLEVPEERLERVDRVVARMPWRFRKLLFVEYWLHEALPVKAKRFNLGREEYKELLDRLLSDLYDQLLPDVERWLMEVLQR